MVNIVKCPHTVDQNKKIGIITIKNIIKMAKENKPAAQQQVTDVDSISNIVKKDGTATVEISKSVMESIKKGKDERLQNQITERVLKSEYQRKLKLLQLRKRRAENDITLKYLKEAEKLQYQMSGFLLNEDHIKKMGGKDGKLELAVVEYQNGEPTKTKKTYEIKKGEETWVPGSITCPEYDDLSERMRSEEAKEKTKLENEHERDKRTLETQYPGYFSYSWRW